MKKSAMSKARLGVESTVIYRLLKRVSIVKPLRKSVKWCQMMSKQERQSSTEKQEWFTPTEAAKYLRVSRQTIYNYMDEGLLPYYELKSKGGRRIRRSDLDALLERPSKD